MIPKNLKGPNIRVNSGRTERPEGDRPLRATVRAQPAYFVRFHNVVMFIS